jgi:membrane protease YdiL (CAAX protease family)
MPDPFEVLNPGYTRRWNMSTEISSTPVNQQAHSRVPTLISWVIIFGLAGLIVFGNARAGESPATQRMLNDERARMSAMLAVYLKSLRTDAKTSLVREQMSVLIKQMESDARTANDKIRVAILAGETLGADAALKRLDEISEAGTAETADILVLQAIYGQAPGKVDAEEKTDLIQRHGYLGRVATAFGVPADKEPRKTLESEAFWFTMKLSVLGVGLMILLGLSVAGFILGVVWYYRGKIRNAYVSTVSWSSPFLEAFALYLVLYVGLGLALRSVGPISLHWTWLALVILPVVWGWTVLRGTNSEQRRQAFGWHRGRGFWREVGAGVGGYLAGLVVIAIGCLLTLLLVQITGTRAASPIVNELGGGPWRLVGVYALSCIFAPFMEETMFRGLLFHHLRQRWSWVVSAALVSVVFAMLHPQGWVAIPALTSIAFVLAGLREWRGSLIAPMAAHAFSNGLVLTLALLLLR